MTTVPTGSYRVIVLTQDRPTDAAALAVEIGAQARRSGGTRAAVDVTDDASLLRGNPPADDPTTVLVVLGGQRTASDPTVRRAVARCRMTMRPCLPVYDPRRDFRSQIPPEAHELNGLAWSPGAPPEQVAAQVLRLLGLTENDRRVFLSYRRTDGSALAHQLRHELLDNGWDVFLDRFNVPPAADFQKRLFQELADKAFVLLLETPDAAGSAWVEQEIAFAHNHRLGLMSIALADTAPHELFPALLDDLRRRLEPDDVRGPRGNRTLAPAAVASVLQEMDERHAEAFRRRRESLMLETARELRRHGYDVAPVAEWALRASRGLSDEMCLAIARPAEPRDLLAIDELRRSARMSGRSARGWIVHPLQDIDEDRARLIAWLCRRRRVKATPVMLLSSRIGA